MWPTERRRNTPPNQHVQKVTPLSLHATNPVQITDPRPSAVKDSRPVSDVCVIINASCEMSIFKVVVPKDVIIVNVKFK